MTGLVTIVGVGNAWRRDDGAGLEVARRLSLDPPRGMRIVVRHGDDASGLLEDWRDADAAIVVDAAAGGMPAGSVHRFDAAGEPLPARAVGACGHAVGVAEAVELGRALNRLPRSLLVYAIAGRDFGVGEGLTPPVERAVAVVVAELRCIGAGSGSDGRSGAGSGPGGRSVPDGRSGAGSRG